jgi:serine/threonine protein kinase
MSDLVGRTLLDQFRVDSFVAAGGMGAIYKVWDLKRNAALAMKVLHFDFVIDPSLLKRFEREARALKRLAHPNIVPFYGFHTTSDLAFLLEEYIDGPSLKEVLRLRHKKALPMDQVLAYLRAICSGLGYAHYHGVVHCDVKPGNIMVDQGGNIYLTDFGIARHAESTVTTLASAGTAFYMSPEQFRGEAVTPSTDIYALGIVLFEMLTGERPYAGTDMESQTSGTTASERIQYGHLHLPPPDPRNFNPGLPEAMTEVLARALEKKPENRYSSTEDFYRAVCKSAGVDPVTVPTRVKVSSRLKQKREPEVGISGQPLPSSPIRKPAHQLSTTPSMHKALQRPAFFIVPGIAIAAVLAFIVFGGGGPRPKASEIPEGEIPSRDAATSVPAVTKTSSSGSGKADNTPAPTRLAATKTPAVTDTPIPGSIWRPDPDCPYSRIRVGNWTRVGSDEPVPNRIRETPGTDGKYLGQAQPGTVLHVRAGPKCVDQRLWWYVITEDGDLVGWTAEGEYARYYLEPGSLYPP